MSSPNAAQRSYYRIRQELGDTSPGVVELTGIPLKGLIRRVRCESAAATSVSLILAESNTGGAFDRIMRTGALATPYDLIAETLTNSLGTPVRANHGIPFQLTPSSPGSKTGSLFLQWTNSAPELATLQLTIEPLVP